MQFNITPSSGPPVSDPPAGCLHIDNRGEYYTEGLVSMSPTMIRQVLQEALALGLQTELEVSKHITANYGAPLLENAALVEQHWPLAVNVTQASPPAVSHPSTGKTYDRAPSGHLPSPTTSINPLTAISHIPIPVPGSPFDTAQPQYLPPTYHNSPIFPPLRYARLFPQVTLLSAPNCLLRTTRVRGPTTLISRTQFVII